MIAREIIISALREWMAEIGKRASVAVSWVRQSQNRFTDVRSLGSYLEIQRLDGVGRLHCTLCCNRSCHLLVNGAILDGRQR